QLNAMAAFPVRVNRSEWVAQSTTMYTTVADVRAKMAPIRFSWSTATGTNNASTKLQVPTAIADTFCPTRKLTIAHANVPCDRLAPGEAPPVPWATPRSDRSPRAMRSRTLRSQPEQLIRFGWPLADTRHALTRS